MAKKKNNTAVRVLLPLALLGIGIGVAVSVSVNTSRQPLASKTQPDIAASDTPQTQPDQSQPDESQPNEAQPDASEPDASQPDESPPDPATTEDQPADQTPDQPTAQPSDQSVPAAELLDGLHAAELGDPTAPIVRTSLGSLGEQGDYLVKLEPSRYGAGIAQMRLARYLRAQHEAAPEGGRPDDEFVSVQHEYDYQADGVTPMSVWAVQINDVLVPLQGIPDIDGLERRMWIEQAPGRFKARVDNAAGQPVLEIIRTIGLEPGSYNITFNHRLINRTTQPLTVSLVQVGPVELEQIASYGGDKRRVRYGYLTSPEQDPSQQVVLGDSQLKAHSQLIGKRDKATGRYDSPLEFWPTGKSSDQGKSLVWIAQTNRYFGAAAFAPIDPTSPAPDKVLHAAAVVERVLLNRGDDPPVLALRLTSDPIDLAPAGAPHAEHTLGVGLYAGPLAKRTIAADPIRQSLAMDDLVAYNFGGFCAICTFSWLTGPLIALLRFVHDNLVYDWALSIIVLVLIVRTILHPVTRWSQIKMQRFTRQMQAIGPKQKKIQEKYKDDRKRLQQEMAKVWREEGISPAGMLGCLPMFLQTPVWIALYATLYYAIELRDQSAFFGLFQQFGGWHFLGDLSQPDHFITFPGWSGFAVPLMGTIKSINLLPVLLGVVFFMHQKYMTPPSTGTMTPEQESTQKIMKVMMVVMFPVFMYNAPSGLAMYFIANSTLGIIETKWIRKHIDSIDDSAGPGPKAPKKPGFFARLQELAEQRQQQQAAAQQRQARAAPKGPSAKDRPARYKKRK